MTDNPSDPHTAVCLCDVGLPGWEAVEVIAPDGDRHLLLANPDATDDCYRSTALDAPHEQVGSLPRSVRQRISILWRDQDHRDRVRLAAQILGARVVDPQRCGRPTRTTGRRCRTPVARPGDACAWLRVREDSPR